MPFSANLVSDAKKSGLSLVEHGGLIEARQGSKVVAFHADAIRALDKARERLEEDRLRKLHSSHEDREPILERLTPEKILKISRKARPPPEAEMPKAAPATAPIEDKVDETIQQTVVDTRNEANRVIKGSIIKSKYKDRYKKHGFSCGDLLSDELREYIVVMVEGRARVSLERLREVAVKNDVWQERYVSLNAGQQRMNIGNRLRAKYAAGEALDIGGVVLVQEFKNL